MNELSFEYRNPNQYMEYSQDDEIFENFIDQISNE